MIREDSHDSIPVSNKGRYSPAIARRNLRKLERTISGPILLPSASSSRSNGADLPPLIGAPDDPSFSRYSKHDKPGITDSPMITRRGRQIKPILTRQASEPQLSHRFTDLKLKPNPPDHDSPRSNGSSTCNSPRMVRTRLSKSVECSPVTVRRTYPGASTSPSTPMSPYSPMSPLISNEIQFTSPTGSEPNSPMVKKRHGGSLKLRRGRTTSTTPDVSPTGDNKRHSLPANFTDYSPRNGLPHQMRVDEITSFEHSHHVDSIKESFSAVDDETGEPIMDVTARLRHDSGGPGDESSTHSVTNQSCDMLYDIAETRDETALDETCSTKSEPPQSSGDESDNEKSLPEYQKSPLSTNNRVNKWLLGLQPSENTACDPSRTEKLLPDIHS
ncbi:uncharacterized protein [Amphiura filiformis]|uniref:uncharacterized protein n=1 Tax=Amphiura filiformis TaxID=82378 RepID=UPI003B2128A7